MYKVGLFVGKFLPPHIGHKWAILEAKKLCEKLVVLVCYEPNITELECRLAGFPLLTLKQKYDWWKTEFEGETGIEIKMLDETGMPLFPNGWAVWASAVQKVVGEPIDVIFGSEERYIEGYKTYFPDTKYIMQDCQRTNNKISSTMIRGDLEKYIDFIIPSAKPFFQKVLEKNKINCQ